MLGVCALACLGPILRALRLEPTQALREAGLHVREDDSGPDLNAQYPQVCYGGSRLGPTLIWDDDEDKCATEFARDVGATLCGSPQVYAERLTEAGGTTPYGTRLVGSSVRKLTRHVGRRLLRVPPRRPPAGHVDDSFIQPTGSAATGPTLPGAGPRPTSGRVAIACRSWCAGQGSSSPDRRPPPPWYTPTSTRRWPTSSGQRRGRAPRRTACRCWRCCAASR